MSAQPFGALDPVSGEYRDAMNPDQEFAAMVDVCMAAQAAVERSGTSEMRTLARILLFQIGQELARREAERAKAAH